jgi:hypothetical protein
MREALTKATRAPLRRLHDTTNPGKPPWPANPNTLAALVRHDLLAHNRRRTRKGWWLEEWTITENGREALLPRLITKKDHDVYLARPTRNSGDYTTDPSHRIDPLPVMNPSLLNRRWTTQADTQRAEARDIKQSARNLARQAKAA